ncbi:hypothetical protein [Cryobacterium breve]|uniref:hypothetical protein n=1 Tax=Cryobacterium breve TaxID=1259258 RepID=UPI00248C4A46|nr:hypothetical protein [Cryobacterium breve]
MQNETLLGTGAALNRSLVAHLHTVAVAGEPAGVTAGYATAVAHFDASATKAQITTIKNDLSAQGYSSQTVADTIGAF